MFSHNAFINQLTFCKRRRSSAIHLRYEAIDTLTQHRAEKRSTLPLLTLYVHQDNAAAIRLYENFGFVPAPQVKTNDHILMSQKLEVTGP